MSPLLYYNTYIQKGRTHWRQQCKESNIKTPLELTIVFYILQLKISTYMLIHVLEDLTLGYIQGI